MYICKNNPQMKGVFKENKDLKYLKEEFKTFIEKKNSNEPPNNTKPNEIPQETLVLEVVEL